VDVDRSAERTVAWRSAAGVALILAIFHAGLFVVVPFERQDFPLSDDWAYSLGAFSFLRGDGPNYFEWSATPLIGQWIWSTPFQLILGENHQALRCSTAFLHVVLGALTTALLQRAGVRHAALIAAVVAFHPLMCLASASFLTDVPTLAFALAALGCWSFVPGATGSISGTILGIAAVLNRQTAIAAPAALLAGSLLRSPDVRFRRWIEPLLTLLVGIAVAVWFGGRTDIVKYPLTTPTFEGVVAALMSGLFFCGLGFAPIFFWIAPKRRFLFGFFVSTLLWCGWALLCHFNEREWTKAAFPFAQNVGNLFTLQGPFGDAFTIGSRPSLIGQTTQIMLTSIAILGAAGLLASLTATPWRRWLNPFVIFGLAHLLLPAVSSLQFDRYYIPVLVGMAFLLPRDVAPAARPPTIPLLLTLCLGLLSFALCRDWLEVNALKWELGRRAVASGIAVEEIEGGLEWDFHHAWKHGRPPRVVEARRQGFAVPFSLERLKHLTGRYALSLGDDSRFQAVDRIIYRRWLPWREEEVVLLKAW
jgi:hypothetical protein